ncbi:uncharacterized protein MELLADRAFT_102333 [Melampsora larici-populina 98AG31]|uniref:Uncharacterized protein n=1 Tax=Melampsora larici-populina (strain 98AG31 / pathotype 3-4-7) TaxID=747676 RepID=F4R7Y3_MELLP|nr:uncharacterized protein MELLADRAFT_102333 [Melampsora larici-populina 98AG31]EGG11399.1 hypothetical protein MELLADRAFT_102333 [Melampsora larici-populina 98AG31]
MKLDEADLFLNSLADLITPNRAISQLETAQIEIKDHKSKLIFLQDAYQLSIDSIPNISNPDPNYSRLLYEVTQTIDSYERRLIQLELVYEMKKRYAVEVLKAQI